MGNIGLYVSRNFASTLDSELPILALRTCYLVTVVVLLGKVVSYETDTEDVYSVTTMVGQWVGQRHRHTSVVSPTPDSVLPSTPPFT